MKRNGSWFGALVLIVVCAPIAFSAMLNAQGQSVGGSTPTPEPTKENASYTIVNQTFRSGWEGYGVTDFLLNDDVVVERFWFSPLVDNIMEEWMKLGNSQSTYADRLFRNDAERALVDMPGCPFIVTTSRPIRSLTQSRWWGMIVPHDREDTYRDDMLRCQEAVLDHPDSGGLVFAILSMIRYMIQELGINMWEQFPTPTPMPTVTPTPTSTPIGTATPTPTASPTLTPIA